MFQVYFIFFLLIVSIPIGIFILRIIDKNNTKLRDADRRQQIQLENERSEQMERYRRDAQRRLDEIREEQIAKGMHIPVSNDRELNKLIEHGWKKRFKDYEGSQQQEVEAEAVPKDDHSQDLVSSNLEDVEELIKAGVNKKREGSFKDAIKLYEKALEIDRSRAIIYTSFAKSLYLDNKRDMAIHNYIIGLSISIIYYANQHGYEQSDIENEHVQNHLVSKFFSTNRHLAHAYIDLYPTQIENLIKNIEQENSSLTRSQVQQIVNYEISNYRFGLAGGGLKDEPSHHDIDHNLNFIHIYQKCGEKIAMDYIDWNSIQLN